MMASERWVRQARDFMIMPSSRARNWSPALMPQPSMSLQSSGDTQAKLGVEAGRARSEASCSIGTLWAAQ